MSNLESGLRDSLSERYRLIRPLGAGAMAEVFLAEDLRHHREVAIKALRPELAAVLGHERFEQEIAFAARLTHPNILPLLDSGVAAGTLYYTMPYAAGESLRDRLTRELQLPVSEALALGEQVARALDYAHRQGVVHRDIKPENILLVDRQAMVADFGIARAVRSAAGARLTESGTTIGTPLYMSPEQAAGDREVDGRSDEYSLACVVHEMLAGQPPFVAPMAETVLYQHMTAAPRAVTELRPTTPVAASTAVLRALAKSPADRFATAGEFAEALAAARTSIATPAAAMPVAATTGSTPKPTAARGPRAVVWIATATALFAVAAIAAFRAGWLDPVLGRKPAPVVRQWVMLAEFDGPSEDPSLAATSRDLVSAALDQSTRFASVPREQIRAALRLAGRPDTSHVDAELARELAFRSSIRVVVAGAIHRVGAGYSIVLRAIDTEDGHVVLTETGDAGGANDLVAALGRVSRELRQGLGENAGAIKATRDLPEAATPSFDAYRSYARGRQLLTATQAEAALLAFRNAIALDPDFAMAWSGVATVFMNTLSPDSSRAAAREAMSRSSRLTDFARLDLEAKMARLDGDLTRAGQIYDEMLALNLSPIERAIALNNQGTILDLAGESERALVCYQSAATLWPIETPQMALGNVADMQLALGRDDDARATMQRMSPTARMPIELQALVRASRWSAAESLATLALWQGTAQPQGFAYATSALWSLALRRGELSRSEVTTRQLRGLARQAPLAASMAWLRDTWASELTSKPAPDEASMPLLDPVGTLLSASLRGDTAGVTRAFERARPNIAAMYQDDIAALTRGVAEVRAGETRRGLELLARPARMGLYNGHPLYEAFRVMSRWVAADAYERAGSPDSVQVYLALILDPPGRGGIPMFMSVAAAPYVHRRLALLEARRGHADEAHQHWLAFEESFTHPDPQLAPLVTDTRAALQAAGAMSTHEKR